MTDDEAIRFAITATAYAARMRGGNRPAYLIAAYVRLVRVLRRGLATPHTLTTTPEAPAAILAFALALAKYVHDQVPEAPAPYPTQVAHDFAGAMQRATVRAQHTLAGDLLARRVALIVVSETQLATARLILHAALVGGLPAIVRSTGNAKTCERCAALAGTYIAPYPADLFYTHPHCACSWAAERPALPAKERG